MLAGRELEGGLARGGELDLVAAGAEIRGERAQDLRLVVDDEDAGHELALQAHDHRQPAAGGVLDLDPAAHRLDEPFRDREPESDPVAAAGVAEPLEGEEHPLAFRRRDARPAVDDPHVDAAVHRAGCDPRAAVLGRVVRQRSRSRSRAPARAGRRRRGPAAATRVDRARRPQRAVAETTKRSRKHLVEVDGFLRGSRGAPVWRRLMSRRLPTRAFRRSVSSSIVARNSRSFLWSPVDVLLEQARDRGLDPGERGAEVVRDGREDRRSEIVGGGEGSGGGRLRLELLELDRGRELAGEGLQDAPVVFPPDRASPPERGGGSRRSRPSRQHARVRSGRSRSRRRRASRPRVDAGLPRRRSRRCAGCSRRSLRRTTSLRAWPGFSLPRGHERPRPLGAQRGRRSR